MRFHKLSHNLYQKKLNELSKRYKRNSLLAINQIAQMIAKQAVKDGYFKVNPISDIKIPYYEDSEENKKFWEPVDIQKFRD